MFSCAKHWVDGCRECWAEQEAIDAARGPIDYTGTPIHYTPPSAVDGAAIERIARSVALALDKMMLDVLLSAREL